MQTGRKGIILHQTPQATTLPPRFLGTNASKDSCTLTSVLYIKKLSENIILKIKEVKKLKHIIKLGLDGFSINLLFSV